MMSRWIVPVDDTSTMFIEFRHVSETVGATPDWWADRVIMFRQQLRQGIKAVKSGKTPDGPCRDAGAITATYCNYTVVRVPPAPIADEDQQLLRATGRKLAESYLARPPLLADRRSG